MVEARCPRCRSMKDPAQPLCGPCALNEKVAREARMKSWLERLPQPAILGIAALLMLLHYARVLICLGIAWIYYTRGNADLLAVWLVLAAMSIPDRKWWESRGSAK